jgi:mRNA-degrading endonuclease RelE of RelBE toxin-antitoxin system
MKSVTTKRFRKLYESLPSDIRKQARQAYRQFQLDINYPSLHFKRVHANKSIFSARINADYRVVGIVDDDTIIWFWVGSHSDYDKLLSQW